jgi:exosortase A-associated hydrolase 1
MDINLSAVEPNGFGESALVFAVGDDALVGIFAAPERSEHVGVVVVVGGPQYRVGSHRQFVGLSRGLAAAGFPAFRFDCRGMGDSGGEPRSFENLDADIRAAIDALSMLRPGLSGVVLWGLCDGASAALMYAPGDPRVVGLALANPWARGAATEAKARLTHYYLQRLIDPGFWSKLARGRLQLGRSAGGLGDSLRRAVAPGTEAVGGFRARMLSALEAFGGPVLWLLSGRDLTAREFELFMRTSARSRGLFDSNRCDRADFLAADHTFSSPEHKRRVVAATADWLRTRVLPRAS